METVDNRSLKEKWNAFKWNTKEKVDKALNYAKENPQVAIGTITTLAWLGKKGYKGL